MPRKHMSVILFVPLVGNPGK